MSACKKAYNFLKIRKISSVVENCKVTSDNHHIKYSIVYTAPTPDSNTEERRGEKRRHKMIKKEISGIIAVISCAGSG